MNSTTMLENFKLGFEQQKLWDTLHEHRVALSMTFIALLVLHRFLFVFDHDPREPSLIKPRIPLIGHAINIYRLGSRHFVWIA